jgi:hypothetical protein
MGGGRGHTVIGHFARVLCPLIIFLPVHVFAAEPVHKPLHHTQAKHDVLSKRAMIEVVGRQLRDNWSPPINFPDVDKVHVRARVRLDSSGNLKGDPEITATGGPEDARRALTSSVLRCIFRAAPFKGLPLDRYQDWREIVLNFDASDPVL